MRAIDAMLAAAFLALAPSAGASAGTVDEAHAAFRRGDFVTGTDILRPLAEQGDLRAQADFISLYLGGNAAPSDYPQVAIWCQREADRGSKAGEACIGFMYVNAQGVPRDTVRGIAWFQKAAEQGDERAQTALGSVYEFGRGVPIDLAKAAVWYKMAAEQGNPWGMYNLGVMCTEGNAVTHDYIQGYMWYSLAISNFPPNVPRVPEVAAQLRARAAAQMTQADVAEATRRIDDWQASHRPSVH